MFWFQRLSLGLLLLVKLVAAHEVFLGEKAATQVLTRSKRANTFWEEVKQGDMERECMEERCNWEEAREIFEDQAKTNEFWNKYYDGDACESTPCANKGQCKDTIGGYMCYCQTGFKGFNCEIVIPELCEVNNGGCKHFCHVVNENVECSCATGYFLDSDYRTCISNETFKCGSLVTSNNRQLFRYNQKNVTDGNTTAPNGTDEVDLSNVTTLNDLLWTSSSTELPLEDQVVEEQILSEMSVMVRIVNGENCPPGSCPWQALLLNEEDRGFCGGTILNEYIILTAAHCMNQSRYIYVKLGEFDVLVNDGNEAIYEVEAITSHHRYQPETYDNDIALMKLTKPIKFSRFILPACLPEQNFAEKVLMQQPEGIVSGFGRLGEGRQPSTILQRLSVPYVNRAVCIESTQLRVSQQMFCAGYDKEEKDACQGDSGGPHVTQYHDTYFVTGVVSWGEGCARKGKYGVYTQVSKYIRWIRLGMARLMSKRGRPRRNKRHQHTIERFYL